MTCKNIPSPSLRLPCTAMLAASSQAALAQTADETATPAMQRVEVTDSSIKRLASETATLLSIFRAEDFVRQGSSTGGQASADLRGQGGDKTLVMLSGPRYTGPVGRAWYLRGSYTF